MLDIKLIRKNPKYVAELLKRRGYNFDYENFTKLATLYTSKLIQKEKLQADKNNLSKKFGKEKDITPLMLSDLEDIDDNIYELKRKISEVDEELHNIVYSIPNLPHISVHDGIKPTTIKEEKGNKQFNFKPKTYLELNEKLNLFNLETGAKITGSRFSILNGNGAKLERALINFMLDVQTNENGYKEFSVPVVVNQDSMFTTGQLPKFKDDVFKLQGELNYFLIPTAEVPLTNIHRGDILKENELPLCYTAYTPCFRKEAGSYGKDSKGLVRQHQFNKVELVKFCKQEDSYNELEKLVVDAESILKKLGLDYRVILLGAEDMGFGAAKCYDIEVFHIGSEKWWECSSCSNFEDFQARRGNIFYKTKNNEKKLVHTLNGSGLATSRLLPAILEYYQNDNGSITIPEVLIPYMNGLKEIKGL